MNMKEQISKNRSFLMGLAILWVVLYHLPTQGEIPVLSYIKNIGYGGVDIFVFLSGFGAFHSLTKNSDAFDFFKRRLKRLVPSYIVFIVVWMILHKIMVRLYFTEICGNLTMSGWWADTPNQFNWYVDCIILFYLLAPYIFAAITRAKKQILCVILLIALAFVIGIGFMHSQQLIAISRLPLFILGFAVAQIKCPLTEGKASLIIWNIAMIIGFALLYFFKNQSMIDNWHYGTYWFPFFIIIPGLVFDLALLGSVLTKAGVLSVIVHFCEALGKASFEIYLWHLLIFETLLANIELSVPLSICAFAGSLLLGYIFYLLYNRFMRRFEKTA